MSIDTKNWTEFGQTVNADFYKIDENTLAVVPFEGCTDNENTAKASVEIQKNYLSSKGQKAGRIIFMDSIAQQTAGARVAYRDMPEPNYQVCFACLAERFSGEQSAPYFLAYPSRVSQLKCLGLWNKPWLGVMSK